MGLEYTRGLRNLSSPVETAGHPCDSAPVIWGADSFAAISTKIGKVVGVDDAIIQSNFCLNILWVSDLQWIKYSAFPLTLVIIVALVILSLVMPQFSFQVTTWQLYGGHSLKDECKNGCCSEKNPQKTI